jgi:hypothetical protein
MSAERKTSEAADPPVARRENEYTDAELIELAKANHIWLNAFSCIRPTPEFLAQVGAQVIACLQTSPLLDDWVGSPRNVTYIRVNRS